MRAVSRVERPRTEKEIEVLRKMAAGNLGRKASDAHRQKISEKLKGKAKTPEHKLAVSQARLGKKRGRRSIEDLTRLALARAKKRLEAGVLPKVENKQQANQRIRSSRECRQWRQAVLARDNSTCVLCGATQRVEVDHIKPFSLFPALRFDVSNGRVLCKPCHKATDTYAGRSKRKTTTTTSTVTETPSATITTVTTTTVEERTPSVTPAESEANPAPAEPAPSPTPAEEEPHASN